MGALRKLKSSIDVAVDTAGILLLVFMTVVVFVSIVFRYAFNLPLAWSEEAARFSFIWMTLLGSVICLREGSHLGIDLLLKAAPARLGLALRIVNGLIVGTIAGVILVAGVQLLQVAATQLSPAIGIPMVLVYLALPISGALFLFELLWSALIYGHDKRQKVEAGS